MCHVPFFVQRAFFVRCIPFSGDVHFLRDVPFFCVFLSSPWHGLIRRNLGGGHSRIVCALLIVRSSASPHVDSAVARGGG